MRANFGDPWQRDRQLRHQKNIEKLRFLPWKCINSLVTQKPLDLLNWNLDTMCVLITALCWPSLGAPGPVMTEILQAENGQKVTEFESIYLCNYRYWWKMVCDFWAHYQPPFFWLCSFIPTWILIVLFHFFFFLFFSFPCCLLENC